MQLKYKVFEEIGNGKPLIARSIIEKNEYYKKDVFNYLLMNLPMSMPICIDISLKK